MAGGSEAGQRGGGGDIWVAGQNEKAACTPPPQMLPADGSPGTVAAGPALPQPGPQTLPNLLHPPPLRRSRLMGLLVLQPLAPLWPNLQVMDITFHLGDNMTAEVWTFVWMCRHPTEGVGWISVIVWEISAC